MEKLIKTGVLVKKVLIENLVIPAYDARAISPEAKNGLERSLERFGYVNLIVVNKRNNHIISGNRRFEILRQRKVKKVSAVIVDMTEKEERALYTTLDNDQIAGDWTKAIVPLLDKLREELKEDFVALRLDELRKDVDELEYEYESVGNVLPDDIPEPPIEAMAKKGDLWSLGPHRLLCGDSTKEEDVFRLMGKKKAALMATDPPYLIDYTGKNRPAKRGSKKKGKDWTGVYHEIDIKDAEGFMKGFLTAGLQVTDNRAGIYIWHSNKRFGLIESIFKSLDILLHQVIVWVKPAVVMGYTYYPYRHEPCIFGWRSGWKPAWHNKKLCEYGSTWEIGLVRSGEPTDPEYYYDVWHLDYDGKKRPAKLDHPTIKPVEVFARPMRVHTQPEDICYEPFCGSGTQIIAAERLKRRCYAMEIEPRFCDVIIERWEKYTGKRAKLIERNDGKKGPRRK